MNVLVTGGAGYIGSHIVDMLKVRGYGVYIYDNLTRGHQKAVPPGYLIEGDTADKEKLMECFNTHSIEAVMHFAAHSQVGESVKDPLLYYQNNVVGGLSLLESLLQSKVPYFIFSSSAAVYGEPQSVPIKEDHPLKPANPYGETKMIIENALAYYYRAYKLKSVSLRYFNAAGARPEGSIGEDHSPETHLIPLIMQAILKDREKITVYGNDYPTTDGTPVRDYVHVDDLARAHVLALDALVEGRCASVYNLGSGCGYSVMEVIKAAENIVGRPVPYKIGPRREGDPAVLVSSFQKAERELGWKPVYGLEHILETAWRWHQSHPRGYSSYSN